MPAHVRVPERQGGVCAFCTFRAPGEKMFEIALEMTMQLLI